MTQSSKTVLIVDDDKLVQGSLKRQCEHKSLCVVTADNGIDAMDVLSRQPCDLAVLDILMPEKEGLETLLEIRQRFPAMPVIVISGGGMFGRFDFLAIAKKFGAHAVLKKPIRPDELSGAIDTLLSGATA